MTGTREILKDKINKFSDAIKKTADISRLSQFSNAHSAFPVFVKDQENYYKQKDLEERIENDIWRYLVNDFLRDRFNQPDCIEKSIDCVWANIHPQIAYSYVEHTEQRYPVEFSIHQGNNAVGYRYTECFFRPEDIDKIFYNYNINELDVICFSNASIHNQDIISKIYKNKVKKISLEEFFDEYFGADEYSLYCDEVTKAVNDAYKYVGLDTISELTTQNIPLLIEKIECELENRDIAHSNYQVISDLETFTPYMQRKIGNKNELIQEEDCAILDHNFFSSKRYRAMIGSENYANSFITSEYLYSILKTDNYFDLTSIVTGYLKSVEQLLYKIMGYALHYSKQELWIKARYVPKKNKLPKEKSMEWFNRNFKKNGKGVWHVFFLQDNSTYFDTTFKSLGNLICDAKDLWNISDGAVRRINTWLSVYCDECRNEHFHKDSIDDPEDIRIIRDNTIKLFYYILGGLKLSNNDNDNESFLGVLDRDYEKMYTAVMKQSFGGDYFLLQFGNDKPILTALPMSQEDPAYNKYGIMTNKKLRFVKVNRDVESDWHSDDWHKIEDDISSEDNLFITPENMPSSICYIEKVHGNKKDILWR